jgi:hypothetical protein
MRDSTVIALFERRLAEFGFRDARLRSCARELCEHREDLKQAALEEGMSEADAEARAEKLLGEPYALAAQISAVLRQSSWYGRHPVITFCLLPLVGMLLMMALGLGVDALATRLCFRAGEVSLLAETGAGMALLNTVVLGTWCGMVLLTAIFFCWLAQRTARGLIWALTACAVCSFYSCCAGIQLHPHQVTLCCGFPPALFHPDWVPLNWRYSGIPATSGSCPHRILYPQRLDCHLGRGGHCGRGFARALGGVAAGHDPPRTYCDHLARRTRSGRTAAKIPANDRGASRRQNHQSKTLA